MQSLRTAEDASPQNDEVSPLEWTASNLESFWDYCSTRERARDEYFSSQFGPGILEFLRFIRPMSGTEVLDYGCGPGYLLDDLLEAGAIVSGADFSKESINQANKRFGHENGWRGAKLIDEFVVPWDSGSFDLVCCIETIEHVLDVQLSKLFDEHSRLLRSGGVAVFTTPFDEDLERSTVYCPNCRHTFHRWQHVRSWTPESLQEKLRDHGFEVKFCDGVNFGVFMRKARKTNWKDLSPRLAYHCIADYSATLRDAVTTHPFPQSKTFQRLVTSHSKKHLVAVATKS